MQQLGARRGRVTSVAAILATVIVTTAVPARAGTPHDNPAAERCVPSTGCLLWAVPTGVDPLAGQTATVLRLTDETERYLGLSLLEQRTSGDTDPELAAIRRRIEQGDLNEARTRLDDWFAAHVNARSSSATAGAAAMGAGVGSVSGDLWSWSSSTIFGANSIVYGRINEYWRQYLSEPSNSTTNRFLVDFTRALGGSFNIFYVNTQCREDHFVDENCPESPVLGGMGYYSTSWYPSDYWTAVRNSTKRFINFYYRVRWNNAPVGYEWQTQTFTTWRFNCGFSLPYCSYTGSS